jgi:hypothetical protein
VASDYSIGIFNIFPFSFCHFSVFSPLFLWLLFALYQKPQK